MNENGSNYRAIPRDMLEEISAMVLEKADGRTGDEALAYVASVVGVILLDAAVKKLIRLGDTEKILKMSGAAISIENILIHAARDLVKQK